MGQILEMQGQSVLLGITPTPDAIVGKFRTYVAIAAGGGMQRSKRDTSTDLYLLVNAWCPSKTSSSGSVPPRKQLPAEFTRRRQ